MPVKPRLKRWWLCGFVGRVVCERAKSFDGWLPVAWGSTVREAWARYILDDRA